MEGVNSLVFWSAVALNPILSGAASHFPQPIHQLTSNSYRSEKTNITARIDVKDPAGDIQHFSWGH